MADGPKPKGNRTVIYALLGAAAVYAGVVLTEPEPPARKAATRTTRTSTSLPEGFTQADLDARFARYSGPQQNAFQPQVVPRKKIERAAAAAATAPAAVTSTWMLTGITSLNGVRSALVENKASGENIFLKAGDAWNGLRVATVALDSVVFVNNAGQKTRLTFEESNVARPAPGAAPPAAPGTTPATPGVPGAANTPFSPGAANAPFAPNNVPFVPGSIPGR